MRVRHIATEKKVYDADFACAACGYKAKVQVLGVGVGSASEGLFERGAASDAVIEARANISADVLRSLELVRCRKCGTRKGIKKWSVQAWLTSAAFAYALVWIAEKFLPEPWLLAPGLLLVPAIYWVYFRPMLRVVDERVSFPSRGW
ncbi:MAG: hypothetical protein QM723_17120 [Myxococcaceae bacterium]